ncbi:MAG: MetQ/NlpA family ABC transporter substrate-binding protein [Candidatus Limivicinus sp.]|nr:MetQ/NlpA family ABC transporter substrate-binding protein [Candidatus Limivicinus sp.]
MKKIIALILTLAAVFSFAACGSTSAPAATTAPAADATEAPAATTELTEIIVGATSVPHAEILEQVKAPLEEAGYKLNIVVYDDYVLPNQALAEGTLDANYFQHRPYLESYNASNGTDLVSAALIHYEPFGIYGNGVSSIADVPDGATILIPADDSNGTRALLLLQQEGLIELPADASLETGVTTLDIVDDHGYNVQAVQADTVPAQLKNSDEGTIAVINGNYALQAGYSVAKDALAVENTDSQAAQTYANVIACRAGDENSEKIQALVKALQSDAVRQFITDTYDGSVVALF